ncbi:MAG: LysM peptidoglycan-binding domain-containing protein, partial [Deltaproteobacteria bacterium]|nr:LysM peptidoglycan-binding domain-containing protein [Deltaproteobacteria bacterium]
MVRFAAVVLALLLMVSGSRGEGEERPTIFLEKKIFSETSTGRKNFYEVHTVSKGENLWKILKEKSPVFPADYSSQLREFRRVNPDVKNPDRLLPGKKIFIPTGIGMRTARMVESGKTVSYR